MESLRFRSWKDFSLGWWNALASAWFPNVRHFENLTPWIQLRLGLRDRAWKPKNGHSRKLAQLSMTIFSKFWSRDHSSVFMAPDRVVLPASRNKSHRKLLTCFLGAGGHWTVISRTQAYKWRNLSVQLFSFEGNVLSTRGSRPRYF